MEDNFIEKEEALVAIGYFQALAKMFFLAFLSSSLVISAIADREINLKPGDKWNSDVQSQNYPANPPRDVKESWTVTTSADATIKVYCLDFRFVGPPENPCELGGITFDDGDKKVQKCGVQDGVVINSASNKLKIDLLTENGGGGIFDCRVKAVPKELRNVEVIELTASTGSKKISFPEERGLEQTKSWKFKSSSNEPIYLRCDLGLESPLDSGECAKDSVTVNNGESTIELCGYKPLSVVSSKGEITMTVDLFPTTEGHLDCVAGIEGASDPASETPNLEVEDSSEHGVVNGAKGTTCPCGLANKNSGRIINGTETGESEYPFMVSLRGANPGSGHFCGASIISPQHILTAAHCVSDSKTKSQPEPSELGPVVGAHHLWDDASHGETKRLKVKEVHIHPTWFDRPGALAGDIAVLVLEQPIAFNKYVSPVCLSPKPMPIVDKYIRAIGWGTTEKGSLAVKLLQANVLVLDTNKCNRDDRETCFKAGPSSSCFGDSGGPYVYVDPETNRYTQVALVSYGYGYCTGSIFIGTNTVHYYDWIQKIVKNTSQQDVCIKAD